MSNTDGTGAPPPADAECLALLQSLPVDFAATFGGLSDASVAQVRAELANAPRPALSGNVERTDHEVPGSDGVILRVHRPVAVDGPRPCLYWIHGGGFVLGDRGQDDLRFDGWCPQHGLVGVTVEYRLAPEHPFPTPLDDCDAGLRWVHEHAAELGIDDRRIGIGGASAGGGLAAGLVLRLRDEGRLSPRLQLLVYPMIDDRQVTRSSRWPELVWPPTANRYGWASYLGAAADGTEVSPYAAPARATDLRGLPPTLIVVGSLDGFSDEDVDYAMRLRHAGVDVELHVVAGAPHGFENLAAGTAVARRARQTVDDWLASRL